LDGERSGVGGMHLGSSALVKSACWIHSASQASMGRGCGWSAVTAMAGGPLVFLRAFLILPLPPQTRVLSRSITGLISTSLAFPSSDLSLVK